MPSVIKMRNYVNGIQCQTHEWTYIHISLLGNTLFSKTIWFKATYGPEMGGDVCNWTQGDSFAKTNFFIPRKKWCQEKSLRSPAQVFAEKRKSYNSLQIIVFPLFIFFLFLHWVRSIQWKKGIIECVFFGRLIFLILTWLIRHLFLSTQPTKPDQLHNL